MELNKFQTLIPARVVERLMTEQEIRDKAYDMNLDVETTEFIVQTFKSFRFSRYDDLSPEINEEVMARGEGRIGLGYAMEDIRDSLAEHLKFDDFGSCNQEDQKEILQVFNAFFDE